MIARERTQLDVEVAVETPLWEVLPGAEAMVRRAAATAVTAAGVSLQPRVELAVALTGDSRLRDLNRTYRGQDKPTNVLSFPTAEPALLAAAPYLGDIAIAGETLLAEAAAEGKPPLHHLAHLVVHGVLHLLGHDHEDDAEAEAMEALERRALAGLGVPDPYAEPAPASAGE